MKDLMQLHRRMFPPLKGDEVTKDREVEFNDLISRYEINAKSVAQYLLVVRPTREERSDLIHKLIENWHLGEAILDLTDCLNDKE